MSGKPSKATKSASKTKKQNQQPESGKSGKAKTSGWEFAPFTKKAVAFNAAARNLAEYVHATYGATVSIAAFEKFVIAAAGFSKEEASQIYLEQDGVLLLVNYQKARDARDAERQAFRSDVKVKDVGKAMASLLTQFEDAVSATPTASLPSKRTASQSGLDQFGTEGVDEL